MFKQLEFLDKLKTGIIIGVFVSVIMGIFITPILQFVGSIIMWSGSHLYEGFSNKIYQKAALGFREEYSLLLFWFVIFALQAFSLISTILNHRIYSRINNYSSLTPEDRELTPIQDSIGLEAQLTRVGDQLTRFEAFIADLRLVGESNQEKKREKAKLNNRLIIATSFLCALLFILSLFSLASSYAEQKILSSFHQRLIILSPKISEQQMKELRAGWALMQNRSDYLRIMAQTDMFAKSNHIQLPEMPWLWE